jgi:hypothetical protein
MTDAVKEPMIVRQFAFLLASLTSLAVGLCDLAAGLQEDQVLFNIWVFLLVFAGIGFGLGQIAKEICRYSLTTPGSENEP